MAKYRKLPVVIEAERVWQREEIVTLEGTMTAEPGDWIIVGVKGERYPCKDDIFRASYEAVVDLAAVEQAHEADAACPWCDGDGSIVVLTMRCTHCNGTGRAA